MTNLTLEPLEVEVYLHRQGESLPVKRVVTLSPGGEAEISVHSELGFEPMFFRTEVCANGAFSASLVMRRMVDLTSPDKPLTAPYEAKATIIR